VSHLGRPFLCADRWFDGGNASLKGARRARIESAQIGRRRIEVALHPRDDACHSARLRAFAAVSLPASDGYPVTLPGYTVKTTTRNEETAMERYDRARGAVRAPAEKPEHKHPAEPTQTDASFAKGIARVPATPEEQLEPDFARGIRTGPESDVELRRRFSEGVEQAPDTPDKTVERRFSEGVERSPNSE